VVAVAVVITAQVNQSSQELTLFYATEIYQRKSTS